MQVHKLYLFTEVITWKEKIIELKKHDEFE